jgi:RNA polymerase primary sigma factor
MISHTTRQNQMLVSSDAFSYRYIDPADSYDRPAGNENGFGFSTKSSRSKVTQGHVVDDDPPNDHTEEKHGAGSGGPPGETNIASIYLKEMNRVPLLTRKKEIELSRRIHHGEERIRSLMEQMDIRLEELITPREKLRKGRAQTASYAQMVPRTVRKLLERFAHDPEGSERLRDLVRELRKIEVRIKAAKTEMIQSNLRLVVSIAKIYTDRGLSLLDLVQEGNMGLMKAVEKYDYRKGFKFSTYASWWIRQAITRALADKSRTIRIPNHLLETRSKITKAFQRLLEDLGREPSPEEIAVEAELSVRNVLKVMSLIQEPVSLETPVGEDGSRLQDLVGSEPSLTFSDDLIEAMDTARKADSLLSLLGDREEQILRLRFGIGRGSGCTLDQIGKQFGISRERVRQIEERALKKLKDPDLMDFCEADVA